MTQTLSRKARISAILVALAMLLTAPWTARPTFASADDGTGYEIDPTHVCTDDCYQNIYYITDNPAAEYYVNSFLGDMADTYAQQHTAFNEFKYYDLAATNWLTWRGSLEQPRFGEPTLFFDYQNIYDALVIFELNEWLPFQFSDDMPYSPTYQLYDMFLTLKAGNCRIMFICNTDEMHFSDDGDSNKFLDLVDVHVNTDIYSYFFETFLTKFTENSMQNSTIILDKSMAEHSVSYDYYVYTENGYLYDDMDYQYGCRYGSRYGFVDGMLLPYIRKTLNLPRTGSYFDNRSLLQDKNINILCYLGGGSFYDLTNGGIYYYDKLLYPSFIQSYDSYSYYFVGSTRYGDDLLDLRSLLKYIEDDECIEGMFDKYMYVERYSNSSMDGETNMHAAGMNKRYSAQFISPVVACFLFGDITGDSLDSFDNWEGRCNVTVKPTSEDTWLLPLSDIDDTISDDEEHLYYGDKQ